MCVDDILVISMDPMSIYWKTWKEILLSIKMAAVRTMKDPVNKDKWKWKLPSEAPTPIVGIESPLLVLWFVLWRLDAHSD